VSVGRGTRGLVIGNNLHHGAVQRSRNQTQDSPRSPRSRQKPGSNEMGNLKAAVKERIVKAVGRQVIVERSLVPECPSRSMTSVAASQCMVAS